MRTAFLLSCLFLSLLGCGSDADEPTEQTEPATTEARDTVPEAASQPEPEAGDKMTAWVDGLFVRAEPKRGAEIVTQVAAGTPLTYTGKESEEAEVLVMRGIVFEEPWREVRTADNLTGWVYGGAILRSGEQRVMGYRSAENFELPYFGRFDLRSWDASPVTETSGGDAIRTRRVYNKDGQQLAIQRTEVGEYGYETNYILTDETGKDLKTRILEFAVDPSYRLTETVTDYTVEPPVRYRRSQAMPRHYSQLDGIPEMATGEWEEIPMGQ
ncbi:SH3 domain-containing protein [Lewinella sp. IMCC34191]|uniref:SH3 domain-containing protein n=1 Tax=Lewinella sp. IMCC34191 TaxID=2259172 RepID=UPI001300BB2A|nr:SH3 domain-containing protein [Lewinella sp. IMCC34191]